MSLIRVSVSLLVTLFAVQAATTVETPSSASSSSSSSSSSSGGQYELPFRLKNLDYWDTPTLLAYYSLDPTTFQPLPSSSNEDLPDTATLFYAQWCNNCHSLAPYWDQIATVINAGTVSSNLVLSVYDCEKDADSKKVCDVIGVTSFPTLMYTSPHATYHDTDALSFLFGKRAGGPAGPTKLARTVKFQGDWRYAEEVMDWIAAMGGISTWNRQKNKHGKTTWKWWNDKTNKGKKEATKAMLPVGIPTPIIDKSTTNNKSTINKSTTMTPELKLELETLTLENKLLETEKQQLQLAATHAGYLIDSMLFFNVDTNATIDIFQILHTKDLWNTPGSDTTVTKSCFMDLSLDYCTRFFMHHTMKLLELGANENRTEYDQLIQAETYCQIIEDCVVNNFHKEECRPANCPFQNEEGCRYVNTCLDPNIEKEYQAAIFGNEATGQATEPASTNAAGGSWGL